MAGSEFKTLRVTFHRLTWKPLVSCGFAVPSGACHPRLCSSWDTKSFLEWMRYPLQDLQTLLQGSHQVFEFDSPGASILPAILEPEKMWL